MNDFRVYYQATAPGVVNLTVLTAAKKEGEDISCEWYVINGKFMTSGYSIYKGLMKYSEEIVGANPNLVFNTLATNTKAEVVNNLIFPAIFSLPFGSNYDVSKFEMNEVDKATLVIVDKLYHDGLQKIKEDTKIEKLKSYIEKVHNITFQPGTFFWGM